MRYIVNGGEPNGPKTVCVIVNNNYGVTCSGSVVVKDSISLTLAIPEPKEVWPDLPYGSGGNPGDRHKKEGIILNLKKNLKPLEGQNITTSLRMILPSGGHDHTNPPPVPLLGHLVAKGKSVVEGDGTVTAKTNAQGQIKVTYTAPEFGGRFEIAAKTEMDGKTLEARDELIVRVPGLTELPEEAYYNRIGGTTEHPSNHWGTNTVFENLQSIAMAWFQRYQNEHVVMYNDISIEYGGMFDNGQWQPTHSSHRIGTDADVRTELPAGVCEDWSNGRSGIPIRDPRNSTNLNLPLRNTNFERICESFGGTAKIHGQRNINGQRTPCNEHYHIDF